jgi:hypothetical protein
MLDDLFKLRKKLRCKATKEKKRIGNDTTHYEGVEKGLWIAYEEAASEIDMLIRKHLRE